MKTYPSFSKNNTDEPLLELDHVDLDYRQGKGWVHILEDINLTAYEGDFICLLGASGCGKTSMLNLVAGYNRPTKGTVRFKGEPLKGPRPDIGVVFQQENLFPWLTVYENVEFGLKEKHIPKNERKDIVEYFLELVGLENASDKLLKADDSDDEMMELWWGDKAREGKEIRTYVHGLEDSELMIGSKVAYDVVQSPITAAADSSDGALEFTLLLCGGSIRRTGRILKNSDGIYDRVVILKDRDAQKPLVTLKEGEMVSDIIDEAVKKDKVRPSCRSYKLLYLAPDGSSLKLWVSNALDITNDTLWSPKSLLPQVREGVGAPPPVSLIGGDDEELARDIFLPSWDIYNKWQSESLHFLIEKNGYNAVFTHLHNVDCAGHQFWHLARRLPPWENANDAAYQKMIEAVYRQTDQYLGSFLPYLDEGWTIFIVSDHGLLVGENVPPDIGEYGGLNIGVMSELGYTVMKKDAAGNVLDEVDWDRTTAVQIRSNYIYLNLKGRDKQGIVDPKDRYELEGKIISDLYNYRDPRTGKRVVGIALRNRDARILGLGGEECGDIFFTIDEGYNRLHGDGLTTARGYFDSSVTPVFIAAGPGIKRNYTTDRTIRQVDVTPTASAILSLRVPAQCEGAPIYQILTD